jgi:glycosyltransferase involved in cell wall biosynthesis
MFSVVVPAHNEALVIGRVLSAMTEGAANDELEVVVVCNGCSDDTAGVARRFGPCVRVVETADSGKVSALNLGDKEVTAFPRVYVDADIVISLVALRALVERLLRGDIHAVAPTPFIDVTGCSWAVQAYYGIRARLPSSREGIGGSGVYALSESGRRRFGQFPELVADDGYVRIQFDPLERETLASTRSIVFAPRGLRDLIAIRTRARYGTLELGRLYPQFSRNLGEGNAKTLMRLLSVPSLWSGLLIYCYVNFMARLRVAVRLRRGNVTWERDETSRKSGLNGQVQ